MHRRQFVEVASGVIASSALGGCLGQAGPANTPAPAPVTAAAFHRQRRFAQTSFGRIAYHQRGSGPGALFLHGFPLNSFQWRDALTRLSPYRRCVAADFLGLGYTEVAPGQSVAPEAQVEMLATLLDGLKITSVDLVANDSGGAVAQLFVARYPARVRSLLLTNCDVEPDSPPAAVVPVIELAREGKFAEAWLAPWVADKELARSPKGLGGLTYTYPARLSDDAIETYLGPLVRSPERKALTNAYAIGLSPNPLAGLEPALRQCTVPLRVVWGTGDEIFSPESPEYLHRVFPNSRGIRRLEGAKLFWPEEFPEVITEEARRLWNV